MNRALLALLLLAAPAWADDAHRDRAASAKAYERVLSEWTQTLREYDGLTTALIVRATLRSPEMLRAQTERWAVLTGADAAATEQYRAENLADAATTYTVVFTATSEYPRDLSFGLPEQAGTGKVGWGVRFKAGERECTGPATFERVATPTALQRALTPMTRWDALWIARFPVEACGTEGPWEMEIAGPHGSGSLRWESR